MVFSSAQRAFYRIFTSKFRSMLWKSLGLTLAFLTGIWFFLRHAFILYIWPIFENFLPGFPGWLGWLGIVAFFTLSLSLAFLLTFFITPITAFIGSFFIDQAMEIIEKEDFPNDQEGSALSFGYSLKLSARFLLISIFGNICILFLLLFPVAHLIGFYLLNAYLFGKEYFTLSALRFYDEKDAKKLFSKNKSTILGAGFIITFFLSVPILNLLTPLFACAMMTYLYKKIEEGNLQKSLEKITVNKEKIDIILPGKDKSSH